MDEIKNKDYEDSDKRKFIKKGFLALLAGVGAAILANTPFVKATNYLNNISLSTALPVAQGGTGSTTAAAARTSLGVKDVIGFGRGGVLADGNLIVEKYTAEGGQVGLIDVGNSTSVYSTADDSYNQGIVQTNILYNSTTEITALLVEEFTKSTVTQGTVDVSFDAGSSWSTGKAIGSSITSFTGTSADGSDYKLVLKFNLGATYDSSTAYMWVTTGSLNAKREAPGSCGTTAAALVCAGWSGAYMNSTEIWSGSAWATTGNKIKETYGPTSCGTTAAALCMGGITGAPDYALDETEKWLVSSWATTGNLTENSGYLSSCGITAAALAFGGLTNNTAIVNTAQKWTGSWATTTSLLVVKRNLSACGITAAALNFGGSSSWSTPLNTTEKWTGSWATTTVMIIATNSMGACGTTAAALAFGGSTGGYVDTTEIWNGSIWATTTALTEVKSISDAGVGTTSDALCIGGRHSTQVATTERWLNSGLQKGFAAKIN